MKRSYMIRGILLAGLALFMVWIARHTEWREINIPTALRGEAATNPFYSAQHLVQSLGATAEWRRTLGEVPAPNTVIVLSDWNWSLIPTRRARLEQWVNAGGRLVIDNSLIGGEKDIERWTGVSTQALKTKKKPNTAKQSKDDDTDEDAAPSNPLQSFNHKDCIDLLITGTAVTTARDKYRACYFYSDQRLISNQKIIWGLHDEHGLQALRVAIGQGSVSFIQAMPFGNRELLEVDHGLLFVALTQLHPADKVYFISEENQASLLKLIWRYGAPAVVLAFMMVALILWRDGVRFGPLQAPTETARRSLAEQIRGTGHFISQVGGGRALHAALVRAVNEAATRRIAHYHLLSNTDRISAVAQLTHLDSTELTTAINYAGPRRATELRRALALLEAARRQLLNTSTIN